MRRGVRLMSRRLALAASVVVVAIACVDALVLSGASAVIRTILALPFALFCPGYALMAVLFPPQAMPVSGEDTTRMDRSERFLLSVVLSLVAAIVGGLVLDRTRFGLTTTSWIVLLTGVTLVAAIPALIRSRHLLGTIQLPVMRLSASHLLMYSAAAFLSVSAIVVARSSAVNSQGKPFTQLWMLPGSRTGTVAIGVRSQEVSRQNYVLRMVSGGQTLRSYSLAVSPGNTWHHTVSIQHGRHDVTAYLYRSAPRGGPYRWVKLVLTGGH